jgi:hypothetical protein
MPAEIVKRTFEGRTNPEANNDPVTSKYYPSHKYAVVWMQYGQRNVRTERSRRDCQNFVMREGLNWLAPETPTNERT